MISTPLKEHRLHFLRCALYSITMDLHKIIKLDIYTVKVLTLYNQKFTWVSFGLQLTRHNEQRFNQLCTKIVADIAQGTLSFFFLSHFLQLISSELTEYYVYEEPVQLPGTMNSHTHWHSTLVLPEQDSILIISDIPRITFHFGSYIRTVSIWLM